MSELPYEPLCDPAKDRMMYFPVEYPEIVELGVQQRAAMWDFREVKTSLEADAITIDNLPEDVQQNIRNPLLFLAIGDKIISDNIGVISSRITIPEAKVVMAFQNYMEIGVHNVCYSQMILPFLPTSNKLRSLQKEIEGSPAIQRKKEFMYRYFQQDTPLALQIAAAVFNEGLFFSSSFGYMGYCREKGVLKGVTKTNEFIARDEWMHMQFYCALYRRVANKLSSEAMRKLAEEAVAVEKTFAKASLIHETSDLTLDMMYEYIEYLTDILLVLMGYEAMYHTKLSLPYMKTFGASRTTDFFVSLVSEYQSPFTMNTEENSILDFSEAFGSKKAAKVE